MSDIISLFLSHFYKMVNGLFYLSRVSHSLFELPALAQHTIRLQFQLSIQLLPASIKFLFHLLFLVLLLQTVHTFFCFSIVFFSFLQLCLNSFLFTVSLYSIVSAAFTPSIIGSTEFLTYHPKLSSSILIHHSHLINPLPQISLLRYTMSISLECSAPCIFINFKVLLSKLFNSSALHLRIHRQSTNCHNFIFFHSVSILILVLTVADTLC